MQTSLKRLLLAPLLAAAGVASAQAADLPVKAPVYKAPALAVPPSWTGFYVGVNAGYGFGSVSDTMNVVPPIAGVPFNTLDASNDLNGFIGGGQIGYNYQITPNSWVAGIEADVQYTHFRGSDTINGIDPRVRIGGPFTYTQDQRVDWLATIRGRLGWTPGDHTFLFYATGGLAVGGVKASNSLSTTSLGATFTWTGDSSETRAGWTVGGGIEARIAQNWTAKVEYLFYDLGHLNVTGTSIPATAVVTNTDFEFRGNIVRAGLNYRF